MSKKSRIVTLIAAALVVVMGVLGVTVLPARASADQSDWTPTHATEEQLKGVLCHADDFAGQDDSGRSTYIRYYFRAEKDPKEPHPNLTLDDGRILVGWYDDDNTISLGPNRISKVVFKDYAKPSHIDFTYRTTGIRDNEWLTAIEGIDKLDTSDIKDMGSAFRRCTALESIDLSHFDTSKVENMSGMFALCSGLKSVDISRLDLSSCTRLDEMFDGCSSLQNADIHNPSTSSLSSTRHMFSYCSELRSVNLDGLNTSSVKNMSGMFTDCSSLESADLSTLDTSKTTDMSYLFTRCNKLKMVDLDGLNTATVANMHSMFQGCSSLASLDVSGFDTSSVTDMECMFDECKLLTSIDVSKFNTANVTSMGHMFEGCRGLTSLDVSKFDTSKVKSMRSMFDQCKSLGSIDVSHFNTSSVEDMDYMFSWCPIQSIDVSNFDLSSVKSMNYMFQSCYNLKSVDMSHSEVTGASAREMFEGCRALKSIQLFHGTCSNMYKMFRFCDGLESIDVSTISRSNPSVNCSELFSNDFDLEQLRVRGDLFASSNCDKALDGTRLQKITIVANSGDLSVPNYHSEALVTLSGRKANPAQRFGKGSETADEVVDLESGGTLAGGTEDVDWYLQALTHEVRFYEGKFPIAVYKAVDGDSFSGEAPDVSKDLPPFMRLNGWYWYDGDGSSFDKVKASGALDHVDRDWAFDANLEWKDEDSEYHSTESYVVRVPSKISYEHQKTGAVDVSTAYDVSVAGMFQPKYEHQKTGAVDGLNVSAIAVSGPSTLGSPNVKLNLVASLSGFDGLTASVSDSDNGDISSRLIDIDDILDISDDGAFIAGKQFKDVLHLSGSVDSAKTITGHITYSCKPSFQPSPTPTPREEVMK